ELCRCLFDARANKLARHGLFGVTEDRDRIEVALLKELSHRFGFEPAIPHSGPVGAGQISRPHRLGQASVLQLAQRTLDTLIVKAGQARLQARHVQAAVEKDEYEPLT